ncbi:MAG: hypothetical protein EOP04_32095, partial [Proteobacteria bacterium]
NEYRPLLHEAGYQGYYAGKTTTPPRRAALAITFTHPNIATVGLSFKKLSSLKKDFVIGSVDFKDQGRALTRLQNEGKLNLYVEKKTGLILGSELFCPGGEHLAHLLAWSILKKSTVQQLVNYPFYHPTLEEGLETAIKDALRKLKTKKTAQIRGQIRGQSQNQGR